MSGRVPRRARGSHASRKSSRGGSSRRENQDVSVPGSTQFNHPQAQVDLDNEQSQSQSILAQRESITGLPPGKMLLPPLPKSRAEHQATPRLDKNRTLHACNRCRKAKAKCSGGQPCEKCGNENRECIYGDGKRDKERKEMERLQFHNQEIERKNAQLFRALLNFASDLSPNKRSELEGLITSFGPALDFDEEQEQEGTSTDQDSDDKTSFPEDTDMQGEENADADVGSPGSLDAIGEDTNRDEHTRAAGFLGKSSAVSWVQRAKQATPQEISNEQTARKDTGVSSHTSLTDSAYHAEPADIPTIRPGEVNAFEWPIPTVAGLLVDAYFDTVHTTFPMLSKYDFYKKFQNFPKTHISADDRRWLTTANIVFAIGARYAHLTNSDFRGDDRDHLIYYARACALGLDDRTLNQDPEIQHVSCLGVLGLYLFATDQLNKSWTVCGIAIRDAMALGLHVRSEARELSDMDKELRVRLWWSLYGLECLLDELTGRPSCISDRDISTPLPINVDESQFRRDYPLYTAHSGHTIPNPSIKGKSRASMPQISTPVTSSSASTEPAIYPSSPIISSGFKFDMDRLPLTSSTYFIYHTRLSILNHEILTQLYCPALLKAKWSEVQDITRHIDSRVLKWKSSLPAEFDFSNPPPDKDSYARHRAGLSIFYNSCRMTLYRLCLCRIEGRITNESKNSKKFDSDAAATCIESARKMIAILPPLSTASHIYFLMPWWNVVHYIVEACSLFMLELAYGAEHVPSQADEVLADSKTAILWLHTMSNQSIAARKSWEIFDNLLHRVTPEDKIEKLNMPRTAPVPPGWRWNRFGTRSKHGNVQEQSDLSAAQSSHSLSTYPDRMNQWINQTDYNFEQNFPALVPEGFSEAYTTTGGTTLGFLSGHYPFNAIYGPYEGLELWQTQNLQPSYGTAQSSYRDPTIFPNTVDRRDSTINPDAVPPELVNIGQVQLVSEMGGYEQLQYDSIDSVEQPLQDYEMEGYKGWNEPSDTDTREGMRYSR